MVCPPAGVLVERRDRSAMPVLRTRPLPAVVEGEPTFHWLKRGSAKTAHLPSAGARSPAHSLWAALVVQVEGPPTTLPQAGARHNSISRFGHEQSDTRREAVDEILLSDRSQLALGKEAGQRDWPQCIGDGSG